MFCVCFSLLTTCVHIASFPCMCLNDCSIFRSYDNDYNFSFSKIKSRLSPPVRFSGVFPSPSCVFRPQCQVFLHVLLPCCFCFVQSLLAYCLGCLSHSSFMSFPQFSFTSSCLQSSQISAFAWELHRLENGSV